MKLTKNSNIPSSKLNIVIGFSLFFIGVLFSVLFNNAENKVSNNLLEVASEILPTLYFVIQITVIMPIVEEYIFRYNIIKNKYWQIISSIFLILFVCLVNFNLFITIFLVLFLITTVSFRKKDFVFYNLMIYFSSLCFSFSHLQNLESTSSISICWSLILLFGLALILISIRIKYGIFYSIIVHILYNFMLISISFWSAQSEIIINNESTYTHLQKEKMSSTKVGSSILMARDTFLINNTPIHRIIENNAPRKTNTFYKVKTDIIKYTGKVLIKEENFKSFINSFGFNLDSNTTQKKGYKLSIDPNLLSDIDEDLDTNKIYKRSTLGYNLERVLNTISNELKNPIEITDIQSNILKQKVDISYYLNLSFKQNIALINENYNLNITIQEKKIECITYFVK